MAALSAWFWNERFWLPHNVTWADLADPAPGVEYPKAGHLLTALPLALGIFVVRILFERFVMASSREPSKLRVMINCANSVGRQLKDKKIRLKFRYSMIRLGLYSFELNHLFYPWRVVGSCASLQLLYFPFLNQVIKFMKSNPDLFKGDIFKYSIAPQ